ncbi:MAG: hypothetical protein ACX98W_18455 [bacterium]
MPQLDLSAEDIAILRETLQSTLSELRYEINDTDSHDYKQQLREKKTSLENVLEQLGSA